MSNNKKDLLSKWLNRSKGKASDSSIKANEIESLPKGAIKSLSYGQKRLWMLHQLNPKNAFYNYAEIYKVKGVIDVPVFESSIEKVIKRHDVLRTTFEDSKNGPIQVVNNGKSFHFTHEIFGESTLGNKEQVIDDFAQKIGGHRFNLSKNPLVQIGLLDLNDNAYILVVNMHHIITDKWSMRVFREELAEIYNATLNGMSPQLKPLSLQYADFAHWEQNKPIDQNQMDYWMKHLANAPEILQLPLDYKRPKIPSHKGAFCKRQIDISVSKRIQSLCKENNITHFVFYLSVFTILLQKYCRQDDLLIGTPISNRSKSSLERMIGFFNDTIVLRLNIDEKITFTEYLKFARKIVLEAFSNKDIPLELLVKKLGVSRDVSINPLFQTMFLYHKVPEPPVWEGFDIAYETLDSGVSKFDLTLYVAEDEDGFSATFEYATDLFREQTIVRMQGHYATLLAQITSNPEVRISELELVSEEEKKAIYQLHKNDRQYPEELGIHALIIQHGEESGDAKAVSTREEFLTYSELVQNAGKVASQLQNLGAEKGDVIGICTNRSVEVVSSILGVLMAGGVYMPIDPSYPKKRIEYMMEEASCKVVLCDEGQDEIFSEHISQVVFYTEILQSDVDREPFEAVEINKDDIAYLIFTSGSSGKPKGVMVTHGNIVHSTLARDDFYNSKPSNFLLLSSFAFDSSMVGLFWTLCSGGNLILTPEKIEQDMEALSQMIKNQAVSHTLMLPSLYHILLEQSKSETLSSLDCVIVAGEACSSKLCEDHFSKLPDTRLYNEYGPTEASVWCTGYEIGKEDAQSNIPIGPAISSTDIFILDAYENMLPFGIPGEIHVGGRGITKGYLNKPELTKEKFIHHEFDQEFPSLLYKTGDLGKMRKDGVIEFLGRVDQQIKIRGFRVELSEIQNVLQLISAFDEVVVVAVKNKKQNVPNSSQAIVAYFTSSEEVDLSRVKSVLAAQLPDYMVPSFFIEQESLPKLPNGKYNLKALEAMDHTSFATEEDSYIQPRTEIEKELVEIWSEILSIPKIGIRDNFFSLGGDSILSIQINGKASKKGLKFPANEIFKSQTIEALAQHVEKEVEEHTGEMYVGAVQLIPIQRWYLNNFKTKPEHWHLGVRFDLDERIEETVLSAAIQTIVERHASLRMIFDLDNAHFAEVRPYDTSCIKVQDLNDLSGQIKENRIDESIRKVCGTASLNEGPLFQCLYFEHSDKDVLVLLAHHLVVDQVSWNIIIEELSEVLAANRKGIPIDLGGQSISYPRWSDRLIRYSQENAIQKDYEYWTDKFSKAGLTLDSSHSIYSEEDVNRIQIELEEELTGLVTNTLPQSFDAKVNEILMAIVSKTVSKWKDKSVLVLETEGHGRESLDEEIKFHDSVGWFTTVYPILLKIDHDRDSHSNLQYIKNEVRGIPSKGLSFGVCKYLKDDGVHRDKFEYKADVLFNYLGNSVAIKSDVLGSGMMLKNHLRSEHSERHHPLEFNVYIKEGRMVWEISYVESYSNEGEINDLVEKLKKEIIALSKATEVERQHNYVPSDFEDVDFDEEDLNALFDQF